MSIRALLSSAYHPNNFDAWVKWADEEIESYTFTYDKLLGTISEYQEFLLSLEHDRSQGGEDFGFEVRASLNNTISEANDRIDIVMEIKRVKFSMMRKHERYLAKKATKAETEAEANVTSPGIGADSAEEVVQVAAEIKDGDAVEEEE